jgi:hypothetical protein
MKWIAVVFAAVVSAAIFAVPASATKAASPSAQAKAQAKAQTQAAKRARADQKRALKQQLAAAKAELKQSVATVKANKNALEAAKREVLRLDKSIVKARQAVIEAVDARRDQKWSDKSVAAVEQADAYRNSLVEQRKVANEARQTAVNLLFNARTQRQKAIDNKAAAKFAVKNGPPPVGAPAFSSKGVLQLKAVDYNVYASTPALGQFVIGKAPASGPVGPAEPPLPAGSVLPPLPTNATIKAPDEPPLPSANAAPKAPPEPPLSRAALTVARADSPYQIIPMSVFKQNANQGSPAPQQ